MKHKLVTFLFVGGAAVVAGSSQLMSFLERWEGANQYVVYADKLAGDLPTVCKGITRHTSPYPVVIGERWTREKCDEVEQHVVLETQRALQKCVKVAVPQSVWDMLTSHAHNFGWPKTCGSESVKAINAGNFEHGCKLLAHKPDGSPNWSHVGTRFIPGLYNRRVDESQECLSGIS